MFSIETHGELHPFLDNEWLLTNGAGAFSSSSVVGCNRRRYHGLLCAATTPPVGRIMALNRIGELIHLDGKSDFYETSINQFNQTFHPRGDKYLRRFELGDTAKWTFDVEGVKVTKELLLAWQQNTIGLRYTLEGGPEREILLRLLPFISLRDFHACRRATDGVSFTTRCEGWQMSVTDGKQTLHLRADAGQFVPKADWWYGHTYSIETDRGLDDTEDLFVPGELTHKIKGVGSITLWASTDSGELRDWNTELSRRPKYIAQGGSMAGGAASAPLQRLSRAAGDFVVARKRPDGQPGTTIIAGYPWFADWGRDTMISLPGLMLTTGRFNEAAQVLSLFAEYVSQGMIPNRFDDYSNEPHYNTVDASLWFIHACHEYVRLSKDKATFEKTLLPACRAIIEGHRKGTRYSIKMDDDGLITAGDEHTQLTWMDAKCNGVAFTPRHGKAVEINALWYNALRLLGEEELSARVKDSFARLFWNNPFRGLFDHVIGTKKDPAIRPNQIFAVSLPHSPLNPDQQRAVVEVVRRELLTPYGLRTLARNEPGYCGRYCGGPMQRDGAYHNGTVWPWLIGPFLQAYLNVHQSSPDALRQVRVWLQPLIDSMNAGCIGQISECFEGDEPHRPVGCPAQAWSVAEVLRIVTSEAK